LQVASYAMLLLATIRIRKECFQTAPGEDSAHSPKEPPGKAAAGKIACPTRRGKL